MSETCCIVNQHCTHPANLDPVSKPRSVCADCEQRVCKAPGCSIRTRAHPSFDKRVRICANCAEVNQEMTREIDAGIYEGSGYPETADRVRSGVLVPPWRKAFREVTP